LTNKNTWNISRAGSPIAFVHSAKHHLFFPIKTLFETYFDYQTSHLIISGTYEIWRQMWTGPRAEDID
jgi:hypothetical protein